MFPHLYMFVFIYLFRFGYLLVFASYFSERTMLPRALIKPTRTKRQRASNTNLKQLSLMDLVKPKNPKESLVITVLDRTDWLAWDSGVVP